MVARGSGGKAWTTSEMASAQGRSRGTRHDVKGRFRTHSCAEGEGPHPRRSRQNDLDARARTRFGVPAGGTLGYTKCAYDGHQVRAIPVIRCATALWFPRFPLHECRVTSMGSARSRPTPLIRGCAACRARDPSPVLFMFDDTSVSRLGGMRSSRQPAIDHPF
jgi:hypothetical protein